MKNKKFLYAIIALVLIMCLGIGYAAVSKTLIVNGTSSTGAAGIGGGGVDPEPDDPLNDNFVVYFDPGTTNAVVTKVADGLTTAATVTVADNLTATITVTDLVELNSYVTVTLKIKNDSTDLKASIPAPTITYLDGEGNATEKKYFEVTTDWTATTLEAANAGNTDEKLVNIKIKLIKSPIKNVEATFKIVFNASAVET